MQDVEEFLLRALFIQKFSVQSSYFYLLIGTLDAVLSSYVETILIYIKFKRSSLYCSLLLFFTYLSSEIRNMEKKVLALPYRPR